jgi:membrane-associated phospholipid phosphatase
MGLFMLFQVRRGAWVDTDASGRTERPMLLIAGGVSLAALAGFAAMFRPGSFLVRGALVMLGLFAASAILSRWIKVSLHLAFGMLVATTLVSIGSPAGWVVLATIPTLAWSRLVLGRHTPVEVFAGLFLGAVAGGALVASGRPG